MHPETARPDGRGSGVDDFLQREQAALREIEALSLTKKKEHAHERHGGTERQRRDFDFATLERHLMSPAGQQQLASLEEAVKDDGFAFLAEKYVTKVEETAEMAEARLKNEQRVAAQEARQRTYLARCKTEADRYWAEVEVKEKAEYEAMILEMEEEEKTTRKRWAPEEKQLNDYSRVLALYEQIPNARRPERVIEILRSMAGGQK